ncbi:G-type lectin S-receptor-like serine/threonine-protein kinase SD1-1 [Impatiens glandulifera]|uniref:G-type lectin S-receptor-like serine/threonine-protein kinase SD1-1 n=1 Tax=Impatiens glandulifera TaxID=253017 RepID=UPI001FB0F777|nr:G-type lectin S-receptor-like serine/threonine-protein kinase SD1-1 [Impatiens glandulifera]
MAMIVIIIVVTIFGMILSGLAGYYVCQLRKAAVRARLQSKSFHDSSGVCQSDDLESRLFDLSTIISATQKFSSVNKIGQGGFGPVYKGELADGKEIAVKRLSQGSGQGLEEFKNEVVLIAKLQHRNLVCLLGCCIEGDERMLIYEYLQNRSLDHFIFDKTKRKLLSWKKRFDIIMGIARGLLYLHEDSKLRIIHRDLKASNILLDDQMSPKISDFGIARIFGGEQTEEMTKRVMGTFGYMSPEYAMSGHFSVKSDVFSFGVLILEIISGKKNWGFYHPDHDLNLIGHAWKEWNEEKPFELVDKEIILEDLSKSEAIKCVQVGLLCVQQRPEDRPAMSSVVFMLSHENANLTNPKEPGFCVENFSIKIDQSSTSTGETSNTSNHVTITALAGR